MWLLWHVLLVVWTCHAAPDSMVPREHDDPLSASPVNISGVFRGMWSRDLRVTGESPSYLNVPKKEYGVFVSHLRSVSSTARYLHNVQGDLLLRDGLYMTDDDLRLGLSGYYIPQIGRLHALVIPTVPIRLPFSDTEKVVENAEYRKALRQMAHVLARRRYLDRGGGEEEELLLYKECMFRLEMRVKNADVDTEVDTEQGGQVEDGLPVVPLGRLLLGASSVLGLPFVQPHEGGPLSPLLSGMPVLELGQLGDNGPYVQTAATISDGAIPEAKVVESDIELRGVLYSENCNMSWVVNARLSRGDRQEEKAVRYSMLMTPLTFFQVFLILRQMGASSTQAAASRISVISISMQAVMDAYLCLVHLTSALILDVLFTPFTTLAVVQFLSFAIFEMRFLLVVWRAGRGPAAHASNWGVGHDLSMLYMRFYGALLLGIFAFYQLQHFLQPIILILFSFWVPQIVHTACGDPRMALRPQFVVGMSLSRLMLPMYVYLCPHNLLKVQTKPVACAILVAWVTLQVVVLLLQQRWGPRWFIPKRWQPTKYDYHRCASKRELRTASVDVEKNITVVECVICMAPVEVDGGPSRMVTPCGHFYHTQCLNQWMDVKMECPTCRRALPP